MTKEKRLGRGLEALLGKLSGVTSESSVPPGQAGQVPGEKPLDGPYGPSPDEPYGVQFPLYEAPQVVNLVGLPPQGSQNPKQQAVSTLPADPGPGDGALRIDISRIDSNPYQPRHDFDPDELKSLAESLTAHGLLQPLVVRRVGDRYQLVAGERRLRAAAEAGWTEVPIQVIAADDRQVAELAIVENLHRKDLNALEKATSFQRYLEQYGCTQEELAGRTKLDRSTIANLIRLLELPQTVQENLRQGKITQGHARALLPLGDEREQIAFCQRIQREGLSVRQTETLVQEAIDQADAEPLAVVPLAGEKKSPTRGASQHIAALEQQFRAVLGTKVTIRHNARGRGKLVIHFHNHEEFERLRQQLCEGGSADVQSRAG